MINNKIIFLVGASKKDIEKLLVLASEYKVKFIDTVKAGIINEYDYVSKEIDTFLYSKRNVLIVKFSGSVDVSQSIADEYSEMIVTMSTRKGSKYYMENLFDTFSNMILMLKYEENI